ncbi:MAG: crossover junction endodeoxyribonuclease RuvC [Candidatus Ratteibacteria bacterium]|jgi:crossover junction endodeoxyribonuclease RuvC
MTIAGFDPGLNRTGFGIIKDSTPFSVLGFGVIAPHANKIIAERLSEIYAGARRILKDYAPDVVAVEEIYFANNPQITLKIGIVRGLLFAAALEQQIKIVSFSPAEVKMTVTGKGNATKDQVGFLVSRILGIKEEIPEDSADALAVSLCYLNHQKYERQLQKAK